MSIFDFTIVSDVENFLSKIDRSGGPDACWPWQGGIFKDGYGMATVTRKRVVRGGKIAGNSPVRANRLAYFIANDVDPDEKCVCHSCDDRYAIGDITYRRCCNPAHLWLGTIRENSLDMVAKGRASSGERHFSRRHPELVPHGEQMGCAKLTEDQVREIRHTPCSSVSSSEFASRFGVSAILVRKIRAGKLWRHVA